MVRRSSSTSCACNQLSGLICPIPTWQTKKPCANCCVPTARMLDIGNVLANSFNCLCACFDYPPSILRRYWSLRHTVLHKPIREGSGNCESRRGSHVYTSNSGSLANWQGFLRGQQSHGARHAGSLTNWQGLLRGQSPKHYYTHDCIPASEVPPLFDLAPI